jgi:hypothetical protein
LSNVVGRRLDSFSKSEGVGESIAAIDRFSQKMVNSGHTVKTVRSILISGMKGYKRRVARSLAKNIPLHRSAGWSASARRTKKLLATTTSNWFRTTSDEQQEREEDQAGVADRQRVAEGGKSRGNTVENSDMTKSVRTTTVRFIEFSKGGMLQKRMRETLDRVTPMVGFKVRIAYQTKTFGAARNVGE